MSEAHPEVSQGSGRVQLIASVYPRVDLREFGCGVLDHSRFQRSPFITSQPVAIARIELKLMPSIRFYEVR